MNVLFLVSAVFFLASTFVLIGHCSKMNQEVKALSTDYDALVKNNKELISRIDALEEENSELSLKVDCKSNGAYTKEYRENVLAFVHQQLASGKNVKEIAKEAELSATTIRRWLKVEQKTGLV